MDIEPVRLLSLAKEAGDLYLKSGASLNESIAKLAEENELNLHQISRVVEETNHYVQAETYRAAEDKTFVFEVADTNKVAEKIRRPSQHKATLTDVVKAATEPSAKDKTAFLKKAASAAEDAEDVFPDVTGAGAARVRSVLFSLQKVASQAVNYRNEVLIHVLEAQTEAERVLQKLAQDAKDHVYQNGGTVSEMYKFARLAFPESETLFGVVFEAIRRDLEKVGTPVEKELIADGLEMPGSTLEIINGEHKMRVDLDTLRNKISDDDRAKKRLRLLDTFGDAMVKGIRHLRTVEDIDKSIVEDTHALEKEAAAGLASFCDFLKEGGIKMKMAALAALLGGGYVGTKLIRAMARGAAHEAGRSRDEEKQLRHMTHGGATPF